MKYFKKADNALDVEVNKLSTIGNQSLIVKNTGGGNDNDMFISNSGLRKAKFRSTADNSLGVSTLAPFSVFKVDGGENLVPEPKIVDVSFVTNYDTLQIEDGFVYGSEAKANLIDIHKIIIESEQEIQLSDYIALYGIYGRYGNTEFGYLGQIQEKIQLIDFISPNKIDITKLFIELSSSTTTRNPEVLCFYLSISNNDNDIYEITQTFTGRTKLGDSITVDVNDENVTVDYDQLLLEGFTENVSIDDNITTFTDLNKECTIIYDGEITDTLFLGTYIQSDNIIGVLDPINELISSGVITYNDNIITLPEGAPGDESTLGFYCLFNVNFSDDGTTPTSVNLVPSSYIVHETCINENPYYFETEGEHEVEFEYVNKFYSDSVYPRTNDYFSNSCIIELNDNFYDYCLYTNMSSIDEDKIEKVSLSYNVPESVVNSIISPSFNEFKEINVNTDKYITINNCVIDRDTFELVTLGGGDITVPSFVKSYGHSSTGNKYLTSIKFLNNYNVTECPSFSGCENLKYVTLPSSMKIDDNKFDFCPNIKEFNSKYASDDKKFLIIDNEIISAAGDEHINIPNNIHRIGDFSFRGRTNLKSITIPDSVTSIGSWAFADCTALTSITIPDSITSLSSQWSGCSSLTLVNIPDSVTSIGSYTFEDCISLTSINIPDSVTSIGPYAFSGCSNLTSINIPNGVTSIGNYAFQNCKNLTSINIPDSVVFKYDAYGIFQNAFIEELSFGPNRKNLKNNIFTTANNLTISCTIDKLNLNNIEDVSDSAFRYTKVNKINVNSLDSWLNLEIHESTYNMPSYRGSSLYINDTQIDEHLIIPEHVTTLRGAAFFGIDNILSVTLPQSISTISGSAFRQCTNLSEIICNAMTAPTISSSTFRDIKTGGVLKVPTGATGYDAWMSTSNYYLGKYGWTIEYFDL